LKLFVPTYSALDVMSPIAPHSAITLLDAVRAQSPWLNEESRVFLLHWRGDTAAEFQPFGGLLDTQGRLQRGHRAPMLVLGLPELSWVREQAPKHLPAGSAAGGVLDWPGLAYLCYAEFPHGLQAACEAACAGVAAPVPEGLVQDLGPLLTALLSLRHLIIDNRQKALRIAKSNFLQAVEGGEQVSPFHLTPTNAFDAAQRDMLERLWALDDVACIAAPASGGLATLRETVEFFEHCCENCEQAKVGIAAAGNEPDRISGLVDAIAQIESMDAALTVVAIRIDDLRTELERKDVP
jgi:hypothetical protein